MPIAINGDGNTTTSQLAAYHSAITKPPGNQTAQEQAVVVQVEQQVAASAAGWVDSGGTGGRQVDLAPEVTARLAALEAKRVAAVNQYAREATNASTSSRAQVEMHGADTEFLQELLREVLELRERLNDSPY